jgi:hypothetical protein
MSNTLSQEGAYQPAASLAKINTVLLQNILLVLVAFAVYWPVLSNQFQLKWDDQVIVINAYTGSGLRLSNLWRIITNFYAGQYAPINQLSYSTIYSLFGYNPFWFHLVGLAFHSANVLLVYGLIKKILTYDKAVNAQSCQNIAFITALLMAIHPFLVESVAWISASKVLIYSFFYLLAIHAYFIYLREKNIWYYLLTILLFVLSFSAKEQAVTLPVCLLLIDYIIKRNIRDKRVWLEKLPLFLLSMGFGYVTLLSQQADNVGLLTRMPKYPFYQNIIFACYSITEYLVKCLIPLRLSHIYPFPNPIGTPVPMRFWIYPLLVFIVAIAFVDFWKKRWIFFASTFFILHLAVALHIIPISRFAIIADRYVYLASIGVFFLIAYFVNQLLNNSKYKKLVVSSGFIYLSVIGVYAHQYSKQWHDSDKLRLELKEMFKKRNEFQKHKPINHGTN